MSNAYEIGFSAYGDGYGRNDYPSWFSAVQIHDFQRGWSAAAFEIGPID